MMFTFRIDSLSARRFAFCLCIQSYTFIVSFIEQSPLIFAQPSPISLAALQQLKRFAVRSHHLIHSHLFLITFHLYFYTHKSSIVSLDSFDLLELTPLDSRPSHPEVNCPSEPSSNFIVWICLFLCHSLLSHLHIHTTHSSIDPYRAPIVASSISVSFLIPTFFSIIFVISAYFGLSFAYFDTCHSSFFLLVFHISIVKPVPSIFYQCQSHLTPLFHLQKTRPS